MAEVWTRPAMPDSTCTALTFIQLFLTFDKILPAVMFLFNPETNGEVIWWEERA